MRLHYNTLSSFNSEQKSSVKLPTWVTINLKSSLFSEPSTFLYAAFHLLLWTRYCSNNACEREAGGNNVVVQSLLIKGRKICTSSESAVDYRGDALTGALIIRCWSVLATIYIKPKCNDLQCKSSCMHYWLDVVNYSGWVPVSLLLC